MTKPDFSGSWQFDCARSALQIAAPDAIVIVIDHREPVLRISRTYVVGDRRDTFAIDLTTDGREVAIDRDDLRIRACAYWDGDVLVFDSDVTRAGVAGFNRVRYAMAAAGESFVADECFQSEPTNYSNRWWMDRVSQGGSP